MSAVLICAYVAQMRALVEAEERPGNWTTQHAKLADLALQTAERMRLHERAEPDLFAEEAAPRDGSARRNMTTEPTPEHPNGR